MSAESETKEELLRCSHCKCRKLPEYFSKNVRGVLYKTCDKCRHKYRCEQCEDKFFTKKSELERHIKAVHDNIKDHHCEDCGASFYTNGELQSHIKAVHLKIKDHHCQQCKASFSTNTKLQEHIKGVHDKIKDHHCGECEYSCSTAGHLRRHIKTCTGNNSSISGLEMRCKEALTDLGFIEDVDYIYNHTFSELTDYCGQHLRPDFRFINHKIMIECDGSQHYKVKEFGSSREEAEKNFEKIKASDKVKDGFCDQFGYKMIRMPYWDIMNMLEILSVELYDIVEWLE